MNEYWIALQQQYQQIAARVNQVVLRERVLLLLVVLVSIYVFWFLLLSPDSNAIDLKKSEKETLTHQVAQLQQKSADIEAEIAASSTKVKSSDSTPGTELVSETTVIPMFKSLLTKQQKIILKVVNNFPGQVLDLSLGNSSVKLPIPLYEQVISLTFDGDYLATYEYLRSLENLKWAIYWDDLEYVVTEYPNAEVKLKVRVVSQNKGK